jgi:hypothetical protein
VTEVNVEAGMESRPAWTSISGIAAWLALATVAQIDGFLMRESTP